MRIQEIFESFTSAIGDVQHYRSLTRTVAEAEWQRLNEWKKAGDDPSRPEFVSMQNMTFREATTGKAISYHFRNTSLDEAMVSLTRHLKRQYQWHLAECYELFETFLAQAYAWSGHRDPSNWPLRDFGGVTWGHVMGHDYAWFLNLARNKKDAPLSILRHFSELLPRVKLVAEENELGANLLVAVTFVAHLRHQIVHVHGVIQDLEKFADGVIQKLGFSGEAKKKHTEFIMRSLRIDEDGVITLLREPVAGTPPPLRLHHSVFDEYVRYLLAYAHHVSKEWAISWSEDFQLSSRKPG
jgi:hypothetical protein